MRIDLFLVIKDLGVSFRGRRNSFLYLYRRVLWLLLRSSLLAAIVSGARAPIRTLSGLRNFSGFALYFRECSSDEFAIHLIITSKKSTTGYFSRSKTRRCMDTGLRRTDQCQKSRRLRPIRGEERLLLVMEFFLQGMNDMLHNQSRKSKGETSFILLFLLQGMMHLRNPHRLCNSEPRNTDDADYTTI